MKKFHYSKSRTGMISNKYKKAQSDAKKNTF